MDYLKKHYEKIILFAVLLGVAGSAFWLTNQVGSIRTTLEEQLRTAIGGKQKSLKAPDLTNAIVALDRIKGIFPVVLSGDHKTFNPVAWTKSGDGFKRLPDKSVSLGVTKITPLNLNITYTGVVGTSESYRYQFVVEKIYEKQVQKRRPITTSLTEGTKNEIFVLREVKGPKETSDQVIIEMLEGGNQIELTKGKVFSKAIGFGADLKIESSNREYQNRRQDDVVNVNGTNYKIISINPEELIIEAPNKTRIPVRYVPNP